MVYDLHTLFFSFSCFCGERRKFFVGNKREALRYFFIIKCIKAFFGFLGVGWFF